MLVKTLLNSVEKHKGFVYEWIKLVRVGTHKQLHIKVRPGKRCKGLCADCRTPGPTYDTLDERRFQFVPLWGIVVFFLYAMRRISCAKCKAVTVEVVPWASGKERITTSFAWFLASWAKRMSWKQVAMTFGVSWDTVFAAVRKAVAYGLAHRTLEGVTEIGVDEVMWRAGKRKYLTVVYQINEGFRRLLWIGKDRKKSTLEAFFNWFGKGPTSGLQAIASDMWEPFLSVIAERVPWALNVLDRFHITANVNKAVDKVRAEEAYSVHATGNAATLDRLGLPGLLFFPPLRGVVTNTFNASDGHYGIDIVTKADEAVKACLDGTVILASWTSDAGYVIQIQHTLDLVSVYKHNAVLLKKVGDHVKAGEAIAIVGNSGEYTTGPHLHFELWSGGRAVDPQTYIGFK